MKTLGYIVLGVAVLSLLKKSNNTGTTTSPAPAPPTPEQLKAAAAYIQNKGTTVYQQGPAFR